MRREQSHHYWHNKTMELVKRHKLGFLNNPGGGEFTRQDQGPEDLGKPIGQVFFKIQVPNMDDEEDYETLLKGLRQLGLEP